jgi:BirA family biotin operon repressor/biotin-[acetyl-CoA-carboxylase] ligase
MNGAQIVKRSRSGARVEVVAETGSTNADLLARVATLGWPLLLVAEHQTAGRGRAGRSWLSSPDTSLTFSLAWRFPGPVQTLAGLPLAVGVALAEALAALDVPARLKWPNDLLKDGAKLAGVLIETKSAPDGATWAVIGVGMNLLIPDEFELRIGRDAAGAPWLAQMERETLLAQLLDKLAVVLREFELAGFGAFSERWNRLHAYQGKVVTIIDGGAVLHEGVAAGVDEAGRMLIDTAGGRVAVVAGDVSLRVKE